MNFEPAAKILSCTVFSVGKTQSHFPIRVIGGLTKIRYIDFAVPLYETAARYGGIAQSLHWARQKSGLGARMGLGGRRRGAARSRCSFIGDEARRRILPPTPMLPAGCGGLGPSRCSPLLGDERALPASRLRRSGPTALATRPPRLLPRVARAGFKTCVATILMTVFAPSKKCHKECG
jgi:hypothetical protein